MGSIRVDLCVVSLSGLATTLAVSVETDGIINARSDFSRRYKELSFVLESETSDSRTNDNFLQNSTTLLKFRLVPLACRTCHTIPLSLYTGLHLYLM